MKLMRKELAHQVRAARQHVNTWYAGSSPSARKERKVYVIFTIQRCDRVRFTNYCQKVWNGLKNHLLEK